METMKAAVLAEPGRFDVDTEPPLVLAIAHRDRVPAVEQ